MGEFSRIAWALRKARLPVSGDGLQLDVGAGGMFERLDPYTIHRLGIMSLEGRLCIREKSG
jgi:hypothetical protein